jgi:CBS domain-containing protein
MLISDVLRRKGPDVVKVVATDSVSSAVQRLSERRIGALVVEDQWMKLVGIFSERDLLNAIARQGALALDRQVRDLMTTHVITCRPSDRIDAVLALMTMQRIRHLPVVDDGQLKGIISIGDLVKHRLDEKELEASTLLDISRRRAS